VDTLELVQSVPELKQPAVVDAFGDNIDLSGAGKKQSPEAFRDVEILWWNDVAAAPGVHDSGNQRKLAGECVPPRRYYVDRTEGYQFDTAVGDRTSPPEDHLRCRGGSPSTRSSAAAPFA